VGSACGGLLASWKIKHRLRARFINGRWVMAAVLIACSGSIVSQVGPVLRWSDGLQWFLDWAGLILTLIGIACAVISIVKGLNSDADRAAARRSPIEQPKVQIFVAIPHLHRGESQSWNADALPVPGPNGRLHANCHWSPLVQPHLIFPRARRSAIPSAVIRYQTGGGLSQLRRSRRSPSTCALGNFTTSTVPCSLLRRSTSSR
jgi:hypothetical protein